MALPSLTRQLREFRAEVGRLLAWDAMLPAGRIWVERLNELRLVRATLAWEDFLEGTLVCYLRGSTGIQGTAYSLAISPAHNSTQAQRLALGNAPYGRWLNERLVLERVNSLFSARESAQTSRRHKDRQPPLEIRGAPILSDALSGP